MDSVNFLEKKLLDKLSQHQVLLNTEQHNSTYNGVPLISDEGYSNVLVSAYDEFINELENYIEDKKFNESSEVLKSLLKSKKKRVMEILKNQKTNLNTWDDRLLAEKNALVNMEHQHTAYYSLKASAEAMHSIVYMIGVQIHYLNLLLKKYKELLAIINKTPKIASTSIGSHEIDLAKYPTKLICLVKFEDIIEMLQILKKYGHIKEFGRDGFVNFISLLDFSTHELPDDLGILLDNKIEFSNKGDKIIWTAHNNMFADWYWWMIDSMVIEQPNEKTGSYFARCFDEIFLFEKRKKDAKDPIDSLRSTIAQLSKYLVMKSRLSKSNIAKILSSVIQLE